MQSMQSASVEVEEGCMGAAAGTLPKARDGDVYIMRYILHDWSDADCIAILSNIRRAMGTARAKLIIAEVAARGACADTEPACCVVPLPAGTAACTWLHASGCMHVAACTWLHACGPRRQAPSS